MGDQLDYVSFIHGFAFLLLAALLWGRLQSEGERLPWRCLVWFGLLHGISVWLDLLAISLGDSPELKTVRLAFLAASFVPLVELGRLGLEAQGANVPGRWAVLPLLALAGAGALAGMTGFEAASRYALGLPGAWLTGWVLMREAAQSKLARRWSCLLAGGALLCYGVTAGLIGPKAAFFPAYALSQEAFLAVCGFPVQLLRALCACLAAFGFWLDSAHESGVANENRLFRRWVMPLTMVVILTGGFWVANWRGQLADSEQRDRLLHQATHIAKTVGIEEARSLSFTSADKANPAFQRLRAQMIAFAETVHARSLYSMAVRNGKILFGPESLAEKDPFASPPGTVYEKPPRVIDSVFQSHLPRTHGPYSDEYGSFVSAFAPVTDPRSGEVPLVIGVDLEAQAWRTAISSERLHVIVFTLALALICLCGSVQLERRRVLSLKPGGWQSHVETWITAMVGLTLTVGAVYMVMKDEDRYRWTMFRQMADALANAIVGRALDVQQDISPFLALLLETDQPISRSIFRIVAQPYESRYAIAVLGWAPRVNAGGRADIESQARLEGIEGFTIHDQDAEGRRYPAERRETHYPLLFVEPHRESKGLLGFDIAGDADRWRAARQAMLSGMPTATDVLRSLNHPKQGVIDVYTPAYKKGSAAIDVPPREDHGDPMGLAIVTIRLDGLLKEASLESLPYDKLAAMSLYQLEMGQGPRLLTVYPEGSLPPDALAFAQETKPIDIVPLFVFGKTYSIVVSPGEAFLADRPLWSGWIAGLVGLFLTLALAAFVESIARRQFDLEELVRLRTAELLESKESYHRQFSDNSAVMLLIDPPTGQILDANAAASKFYGYSHDTLVTLTLMDIDLCPLESLPGALSSVTAEQCRNLMARHCLANGAARDVEVFYSLIVFQGQKALHAIVHDITERKRTQEALQKAEERYRALFEGAGDAILIMRGDRYVDCNQMTLGIFGCHAKQDIVGSPFWKFSPPRQPDGRDSREKGLEIIDAAMEGMPQRFGWKHVRNDGTDFDTEVSLSSIESGEMVLLQALVRDVSERKQAEEKRRSLEERLRRAEKMEALGTLAGGVAHDLNNVLGIVVGYSELLAQGLDNASSERSHAMAILKGGQRAAAIVQDLLTLARRGAQARTVLNLNRIVLECQTSPELELILSYHPDVRLKTDLDPSLLNVSGSSVHLGKAFLNLVSNAAEAMPRGGLLTIRTRNRYLDRPVSGYDEVREGDYVVLTVSDTGEGIPDNDLGRIFEPFYTKKVMGRSGTGLGLAVVWGTVKDHLGYINVESEVGKGTTFALHFPVTREEMTREQDSIAAARYMGKGESILIVDDVREQRELAATMLKRLSYNVVVAASGEEAVKYLEQHAVDLTVLDMIMEPGMDGLDTYRKILETRSHQKAIIVSGFSETERVVQAQALGVGAYVKKPYVLEKLGMAVRNELDKLG